MQLESAGAVILLLAAGLGKSSAGEPGKLDFCCSTGHRLAYYLFTFHVKFSPVREIFV